ncbi:MAG: hypothetical protein QM330_11660 [Acidobacteriota bacterium]|jgi:hypothetical protein|nr:hypothetical protein [Acidobacteriota bacterium]NLT31871.1 cytochrome c maturation protein CcmE [Acidobacteriota bacterium]
MARNRFRACILWTGIIFSMLILSGCEQKTINQILADPSQYANKEVAVAGTVTWSTSLLGNGVYEIEDGTGKLLVVSTSGVPRKGAQVVVKGKVREGFDLSMFNLPDPIASGLVLMASSHKAR